MNENEGQLCPVCGGLFGCTRMSKHTDGGDFFQYKIYCWSKGCISIKFQNSRKECLALWNSIKPLSQELISQGLQSQQQEKLDVKRWVDSREAERQEMERRELGW